MNILCNRQRKLKKNTTGTFIERKRKACKSNVI